MDCKLIHTNLIGYIEQTLPKDISTEISEHLGSCTSCQALFEDVSCTYNSFSQEAKPSVSPFLYTRIEQKLRNKHLPEISITPVWLRRVQPIAATVLLLVGVSLGIYIGKNLSNSTLSFSKNERSEVLNAYASEYYLTSSTEENLEVLLNTQ